MQAHFPNFNLNHHVPVILAGTVLLDAIMYMYMYMYCTLSVVTIAKSGDATMHVHFMRKLKEGILQKSVAEQSFAVQYVNVDCASPSPSMQRTIRVTMNSFRSACNSAPSSTAMVHNYWSTCKYNNNCHVITNLLSNTHNDSAAGRLHSRTSEMAAEQLKA